MAWRGSSKRHQWETPRAAAGISEAELKVSTGELCATNRKEGGISSQTPKEKIAPQPDSFHYHAKSVEGHPSGRRMKMSDTLKEDTVNHFTFLFLPSHTNTGEQPVWL